MLHFECDYNNGCHQQVLDALVKSNSTFETGYGEDRYTALAKERIKTAIGNDNADIFFLAGGTQTNMVVISSILKPWQGVIAADTGHIRDHEAGAIEATGHKVFSIKGEEGKLKASDIEQFIEDFNSDGNVLHMAAPGMVYISFPTELGTIYSKKELSDIYSVCRKNNLPLYIDGARLAYGLMSRECDLSLQEFAKLCDVFYIGGTKVGTLCGEAVVFTHNNAPEHFFTMYKQRGALFAKGRLCGAQFSALFDNNLYFEMGKHAIEMAEKLKEILEEKNYRFFLKTPTNQQFVIVENTKLEELKKHVVYAFWQKFDNEHTVIRFCTSWATEQSDLNKLKEVL